MRDVYDFTKCFVCLQNVRSLLQQIDSVFCLNSKKILVFIR